MSDITQISHFFVNFEQDSSISMCTINSA